MQSTASSRRTNVSMAPPSGEVDKGGVINDRVDEHGAAILASCR